MKASAPYLGCSGPSGPSGSFERHSLLVIMSKPEYLIAGHASFSVVAKISPRMRSTSRPAPSDSSQKRRSPRTLRPFAVSDGGEPPAPGVSKRAPAREERALGDGTEGSGARDTGARSRVVEKSDALR